MYQADIYRKNNTCTSCVFNGFKYISSYDLVFLSETWLSNKETMNFDIPGFCSELIPGNKTKNTTKGRYSGGLAFYYKNNLKNCTSIVKTNQTGILWIKVNEQLFPFDQELYICHIYVPPTDSKVLTSSNIDLYDQLEQDIIKYNDQGKVFVFGDLNARTATEKDFFDFDKYLDQNVLYANSFDIPSRANQDIILDYNGRTTLDLCKSTGLLIANGRLFNDTNIGKFTFCSHRGQSTVDYLLLNFEDFENISYFDILEQGLPKKRQGATRSDTKRQEAFKQFVVLKMSK